MTAVLNVLALWRQQAGWLLGGAALTVLSVLALAALATAAGATPLASAPAATAISAILLLRILGASRVGLRYIERLATHAATFRALAGLRVRLFGALATRSAGGLGFQSRGDALSRLVTDVDALDGLYLRILIPIIGALVLLPILALTLASSSLLLALAVCTLFAIATLVIPALAARATLSQAARLTTAAAELRTAALDAFAGMKEVIAFGNEGQVLARIQAREAALFDAQCAVARNATLAQAAAALAAQAALLILLLTSAGPGPLPALLPALLLTLAAFEAAAPLPRAGALAGQAAAAAARVLETATIPPTPYQPPPTQLPPGTSLRLEAVHYAWPGRPPLFDDLTLDIQAGARVAILGASGAGKSTIAALLLKAATPTAGRILLGGTDTATLDTAALRTRFAWLSQETHVFADTIRNNLLLALPDVPPGTDNDPALWQALRQAGIAETILALPDRLDTWVGEGNAGLSGGQERRIALARALLSPAPILILDEPATGLDDAAERAFLTTLNDVAPGRTVILIVHRLLGVERIDRIFRLSAGRAVAATG